MTPASGQRAPPAAFMPEGPPFQEATESETRASNLRLPWPSYHISDCGNKWILKLMVNLFCCYCGTILNLRVKHLGPSRKGQSDAGQSPAGGGST